jgi:hypothetical protein
MLRTILAIPCGMIAGIVSVTLIHLLSGMIYPLPAGLDMNDAEALNAYVASMPLGALLLVLLAHASGSFVGALVCTLVAGRRWLVAVAIIGGFFLLGGILNLMQIHHSVWFAIVDLLLYLPAAYAGLQVGSLFLKDRTHPLPLH